MLLIGMDRIKDEQRLVSAYDDAQGVTAAFNLNLLERINRELDGRIPIEAFRHRAIWNDDRARIEMHLEARVDITFTIEGRPFEMAAGETIHTENSHKYGARDGRILLRAGGWTPIAEWTDPEGQFALTSAEAQPADLRPGDPFPALGGRNSVNRCRLADGQPVASGRSTRPSGSRLIRRNLAAVPDT